VFFRIFPFPLCRRNFSRHRDVERRRAQARKKKKKAFFIPPKGIGMILHKAQRGVKLTRAHKKLSKKPPKKALNTLTRVKHKVSLPNQREDIQAKFPRREPKVACYLGGTPLA